MKVGVLALQGDVEPHAQVLSDLGADPVEVRAAHELVAVDALVVPGGESTTMSLLLGSSGLADPMSERLSAGMPAFGTCAGLILLAAEVRGGRSDQRSYGVLDVAVRRNAFGRQLESFECDLDVAGVAGGPVRGVFIRAPVVEHAGPKAEVLAALPSGAPVAGAVVCRQGAVLGAAFHPELSGDVRLHQLFLSMIEEGMR